MTLADYLELHGNSASKLADDCKVAVSTISRAAKGTITPSRNLMAAIYKHTGGQVTPNDFWGIPAHTPERAA